MWAPTVTATHRHRVTPLNLLFTRVSVVPACSLVVAQVWLRDMLGHLLPVHTKKARLPEAKHRSQPQEIVSDVTDPHTSVTKTLRERNKALTFEGRVDDGGVSLHPLTCLHDLVLKTLTGQHSIDRSIVTSGAFLPSLNYSGLQGIA